MPRALEVLHKTYGRLYVESFADKQGSYNVWNCLCRCGERRIVRASSLAKSGGTRSCGCLNAERIGDLNRTHGLSKTRIYRIYKDIKRRCLNPNRKRFESYGGRGIEVFEGWLRNPRAFIEYVQGLPDYEDSLSLDRINNDGNYEPGNLRWSNNRGQSRNKRTNRIFTVFGKTASLVELVEEFSAHNYDMVRFRLNRGMSIEDALLLPRIGKGKLS